MKFFFILTCLLSLLLSACSSNAPATRKQEQPEAVVSWPAAVGPVNLRVVSNVAESARLDVGLVIFDAGIPQDTSTHSALGIFPSIREAEARYMPVVLRQALIASDAWGVVRVLPESEAGSELLVTGKILQSDGLQLVLAIKAVDATGRVWLDQVYRDLAAENDYPVAADDDPYADLYFEVANDLLAVKASMAASELAGVRQVALLRYAASLSPEAFAGYFANGEEGSYALQRLPAEGDPMLARVDRIRNQEHLFIDTVDEQFNDLYVTMAPTYHLWRQYGREQALYREEYQERVEGRDRQGTRGSFFAMQRTYDAFKWTKIQEQDLDELATGFSNEVQPTVMEVSGKVFQLDGSLDSQYAEWRNILRSIFALETGLPAAAPL